MTDPPVSEDGQIYIGSITAKTQSPTPKRKTYEINSTSEDWLVALAVNGTRTISKIDSGSQVNTILMKDYHILKNKPGLKPTRTRLTAYFSRN